MRKLNIAPRLVAALSAVGVLATAAVGAAQVDVNPPTPNVMLLVDTSGSMEYKASDSAFPTCTPGTTGSTEKSRWMDLVEVLTGNVDGYSCYAQDRSSSAFATEYRLGSNTNRLPADYEYANPYHRMLSNGCAPGPDTSVLSALQTAPYSYPNNWLRFHDYNNLTTACGGWNQAQDGLLDSFKGRVRFGLMTFDTHVHRGDGVSGTSSAAFTNGIRGTWSYYLSGARQGMPAGCAAPYDQEVGARNAAAPPWEGRMVSFGGPTAPGSEVIQRNEWIQDILLTTRPYGATPIAGMLDDAREFLWNDTSQDPLDNTVDFSPRSDPFVNQGCRTQTIILLSDGEPNLDLRPSCEGAGQCPYDDADTIAYDLANDAIEEKRIRTFVIGFAVSEYTHPSTGATEQCEDLTDAELSGSLCNDPNHQSNRELQVCCRLSRIAFNGDTGRAYFPTNRTELRTALSQVLSQVTPSTSRTLPVFASAGSAGSDFAASMRFHTAFTPKQFSLWSAVLERQRIICKQPAVTTDPIEPEIQALDEDKGDDFVANVRAADGSNPRTFISVRADVDSSGTGTRNSERSIRPRLTTDDGAGTYDGDQYEGQASSFVAATQSNSIGVSASSCPGGATTTDNECRDRVVQWTVGLDNGTGNHRCADSNDEEKCNLVGDIYHSTPRVVPPPLELLRDESYTDFAIEYATRPSVLYVSTNDGFLHAFDTSVDSKRNNELWAFAPPAVLKSWISQYPGVHQNLLDGAPIVKDVVATQVGQSDDYDFERSKTDAQAGAGEWRSVLLQSFGTAAPYGGYFALDVTNPEIGPAANEGPRFLWQLTQTTGGDELFGATGTPVITTLFFQSPGTTEVMEVPVAVLPGGNAGQRIAGTCNRTQITNPDSAFPPRTALPCWNSAADPARSITIVRLDTGEIVRRFAPAGLGPAGIAGRVTDTELTAPMTGQPVAFPGDTGAVADRIFVGDADGTMWRIDVSDPVPSNWEMDVFWDAYPSTIFGKDDGEPIVTPPVVSVDGQGQVTVAFSTGDQDVLTATPNMAAMVWSVTETVSSNGQDLIADDNWYTRMNDGERVAGPMTLFNGALYFSSFLAADPTSASDACSAGNSKVWGVDYILPKETSDVSQGGAERLPEDPTATAPTFTQFIDSNSPNSPISLGATIFGVGVAQLPSCNEVDATFSDPYLGGAAPALTRMNPGKFQLVFHTGAAGTAISGGQTKTVTVDLPTPPSQTRVDSWAAIIE